ncbi:hypothetical protein [Burkholderia cepacia]|uniref:hypothetical protein n=1 Tax=Burkholderia cepacia TaxID=292 RepID=UPI00075DCD80|nr:hypothetical protein [Burkholderia cepacia]KWF99104.1 hypothetical protein WL95_00370 [Burkholderia cepacia]
MATLKKFTVVDPSARVNLSFKESTRTAIAQYQGFYLATYGESCERSELVEQLLTAWFDQDRDFKAYVDGLTAAQKASIRKQVAGDAGDTPVEAALVSAPAASKAAAVSAQVSAPVSNPGTGGASSAYPVRPMGGAQ